MQQKDLSSRFDLVLFKRLISGLVKADFYNDEKLIRYESEVIKKAVNVGHFLDNRFQNILVINHAVTNSARVKLATDTFKLMAENNIDHALVAYISDDSQGDWRLSYVQISINENKGKINRSYSNPRRYSYVLGPSAKVKTPYLYLVSKGQASTTTDLTERFSLEVVNREFYSAISSAYLSLVGKKNVSAQLTLPGFSQSDKTSQQFAVRLLGRIIFCWFLKQKSSEKGPLIPGELLSLEAVDRYQDYYHEILEPLFFETLNTEISARDHKYKTKPWIDIPYLNGGLFSPDRDSDFYEIDRLTNTSLHTNTLKIANTWFLELFRTLETYNFTIDENTMIDQELSIDPEMLGRIFENLLAEEFNEETKESARKSTGSFYTPRQIVEYMVDESLVQFLHTNTKISLENLQALVSYDEVDDLEYPINDEETDSIIKAIGELRILDPACGSGAYPMGILQKVIYILQKLDPGAKKWLEAKISAIPDEAFKERLRNDYRNKSLDYIRKSFVIKDSIYGVDIQPIAVEVAKLRCFLTLIIDEDINDAEPNRGIDTLPNLDFKFVAANTLIRPPVLSSSLNLEQDFENRLERAIESYFQPHSSRAKFDAWQTIDELIEQKSEDEFKLAFSMQTKYYDNDILNKARAQANAKKVAASLNRAELWKSYKNILRHKTVGFFDTKYFFPAVKDGFDIVIGNPPYIQLQKNGGELADIYKEENFDTFVRSGDIYSLFYERGIQLLKSSSGLLCYITSNKWMRAGYGEKLRQYLLKYNPIKLIDFGGFKVFESATVDTSILLIQKTNFINSLSATHFRNDYKKDSPVHAYFEKNQMTLKNPGLGPWFIGDLEEQNLKQKVESVGTPLKNWGLKIYRGVLTGCNEAFIIDRKARDELVQKSSKNEEIIKPLLRGRDIKRYEANFNGMYLLATGYDLDVMSEYPDVYDYIKNIADGIADGAVPVKGKGVYDRGDQGKDWWNLRACSYYDEFSSKKIMYSEIVREPQFYLDLDGSYYAEASSFIMIGEGIDYLTAVLNSKAATFFFRKWYAGGGLGGSGIRYKKAFLENLPVPKETPNNTNICNQLSAATTTYIRFLKQGDVQDKDAVESTINSLVYQLYELTTEDIEIIEREEY